MDRRLTDGTAERALDIAERLVQMRGFHGFSYRDVAAELGITRAALHYHFPGKAELGEALVSRYADQFAASLAALDATDRGAPAKLRGYVDLYAGVLAGNRMCLCGMLAAEYQTLPDVMRRRVEAFFDANAGWLAKVLDEGWRAGTLAVPRNAPVPATDVAAVLLAGLEGALLISRLDAAGDRFRAASEQLLAPLMIGV